MFAVATCHFSSEVLLLMARELTQLLVCIFWDTFRSGPWWNWFKLVGMAFCLLGDRARHRFQRHWCLRVFAPYHGRAFLKVRRLSFQHLYCHDAKRPDVHLGAVGLASHNFRGHPVNSPDHGAPSTVLRGELSTEAKIS